MVRRALNILFSKISGLREAAFWLSVFAFFSQLLALARDRLLAHFFGAGLELDIYYAAFKVPDIIFVSVASLVSISALVPLFAKKETSGDKHLKESSNSILTVFLFTVVLVSVLAWIFMPRIITIFFGEFGSLGILKVISLSRLLLLSPILLGLSNFFGSIVQYEKRFILYSISPLLYNMGIIMGIVFGLEEWGVYGVGFGVILGALLHMLLQATFVFASSMRPRLTFKINWKEIKEIAYISIPRTFALSVVTIVSFVFASLAARFGEGSVAVFNLAFNLQSAPLSLIGVSFSLAAFPSIAISVAKGGREEVVAKISEGLRQIIFWSLPAIALSIVLRAHLVRVVLGSGNFDWSATRLTAAIFAVFVLSSVFQSLQLFFSRSFYALGKTRLPLIANLVGGFITILLAFLFINYSGFDSSLYLMARFLDVENFGFRILILPLAFTLGSAFTAFFLFAGFGDMRNSIYKNVSNILIPNILASLIAGFVAYIVLGVTHSLFDLESFLGVLGHGFLAGIFGIVAFTLGMFFMKSEEIREILKYAKTGN